MLDRSLITILYLPAFRSVTFLPAFFNEMLKPGPTTPLSVGVAAEADVTTTSAAPSSVTSASRMRSMPLLCEFRPRFAPGMVARRLVIPAGGTSRFPRTPSPGPLRGRTLRVGVEQLRFEVVALGLVATLLV